MAPDSPWVDLDALHKLVTYHSDHAMTRLLVPTFELVALLDLAYASVDNAATRGGPNSVTHELARALEPFARARRALPAVPLTEDETL